MHIVTTLTFLRRYLSLPSLPCISPLPLFHSIIEPSTSPSPTTSTGTDSSVESGLSVRWQIVVIAVNVVIVIGLLIIIPLVMACICTAVWRKRTTKQQRRRARGKMTASYTRRKRPKSMAEHLQLEESDVETVDFGKSPTEILSSLS